MKILERSRSNFFIINFKQMSNFVIDFQQVNMRWELDN